MRRKTIYESAYGRQPGRYRERLAQHLQALGINITAWDIDPAEGRWRNRTCRPGAEDVRWWARGKANGVGNLPIDFGILLIGHDNIKLCAARGVDLNWHSRLLVGQYEVTAKP